MSFGLQSPQETCRWANYEWSRQSVYVKHYYFYIHDEDFGPVVLKVCTYLPFAMKLIINGHEWAKRQLDKRGMGYESLDNGFRSCQDPAALQSVCDQFGPEQIEALFRKWLHRLPCPLTAHDQAAGYRHEMSTWQLEFSRTQVFERPVRGREFFEEVIRENLDLGRPERIQRHSLALVANVPYVLVDQLVVTDEPSPDLDGAEGADTPPTPAQVTYGRGYGTLQRAP